MAYEMQKNLVTEIASLVREFRKGGSNFVKFGFRAGIALNRLSVGGGIMFSPKEKAEKFSIGDPAFRDKYGSDEEAFFAAFESFTSNGQFLAWDGKAPDTGDQDMIKTFSEDYKWPTMSLEMTQRRRGGLHEQRLRMFFIGFPNDKDAADYALRMGGVK